MTSRSLCIGPSLDDNLSKITFLRVYRVNSVSFSYNNLDDQAETGENLGLEILGGVPERSKGADCKSVGSAFGGSNPPPSTRRSPASFTVANRVAPVQLERRFIRRLKCSERV